MKKILYLFSFLLLSNYAIGQKIQQVLGLQTGTYMGTDHLRVGSTFEPTFLPFGGIYYNLNFNHRLGINAALLYQRFVGKNFISGSPENDLHYKYVFTTMELPINLALNLDKRENIGWKTYFNIGYTYNYFVQYKQKSINNNQTHVIGRDWYSNNFDGHFVNAGVEIRHNFKDKYSLSINPNARFSLNGTNLFEEGYLGLNLKFGRIL